MASIWRHPRSQYWTACFRDATGRQRRISTKETDQFKAELICKTWAETEQSPSPNLSSRSDKPMRVYFAGSGNQVKIGTSHNPPQRVESFRTARPNIKLLGDVAGGHKLEAQLHKQFAKDCLGGEWFSLTPELERTIGTLLKGVRLLESPIQSLVNDPQWGKPAWVAQRYGLPRCRVFELIKEGQIPSALIRRKGRKKGLRLIELSSVTRYLEQNVSTSERSNG
jgi:hypothetical protein